MAQAVLAGTIRRTAAWGSAVALTTGVHAAEPTGPELQEQMKRLLERVQKLEQRNAEAACHAAQGGGIPGARHAIAGAYV